MSFSNKMIRLEFFIFLIHLFLPNCNFPSMERKVDSNESRILSDLIQVRAVSEGDSAENGSENSILYSVGGTATGIPLNESILLQNNFSEVLGVFQNGQFVFLRGIQNQSSFNVTIFKNPQGRTCSVLNGIGKIENENFSGIIVTCL